MSSSLPWTRSIIYESNLDDDELAVRDAVCEEFMYDRSWVQACKRVGMQSEMATDYAGKFAQDSYCQKKVRELEEISARTLPADKKSEDDVLRQQVIENLKREANYFGPGASAAARVAANKELGKILGMEPVKKTQLDIGVSSGVMLVPSGGSAQDWEIAATEAQEKLQRETLDGLDDGNTVH